MDNIGRIIKKSINDNTYISGSDNNKRPMQHISETWNAGNGWSNNRENKSIPGYLLDHCT